jgi:hypothetical protein
MAHPRVPVLHVRICYTDQQKPCHRRQKNAARSAAGYFRSARIIFTAFSMGISPFTASISR